MLPKGGTTCLAGNGGTDSTGRAMFSAETDSLDAVLEKESHAKSVSDECRRIPECCF